MPDDSFILQLLGRVLSEGVSGVGMGGGNKAGG